MNKITPVLVMLLIALVFVSGCVTPTEEPTEPTGPAVTEPAEVEGVGNGISDLDTLNQELDISDLETLDSDLGDLNW